VDGILQVLFSLCSSGIHCPKIFFLEGISYVRGITLIFFSGDGLWVVKGAHQKLYNDCQPDWHDRYALWEEEEGKRSLEGREGRRKGGKERRREGRLGGEGMERRSSRRKGGMEGDGRGEGKGGEGKGGEGRGGKGGEGRGREGKGGRREQ
jgi:hypothetical protein